MTNLQAAGLNETEAKTYQMLLTKQRWQPSELAKTVNESRTNMYKILDKLVDKKLAIRFDFKKKLHYRATNPSHLLELAHEERKRQEQSQKELELATQELTGEYIKTHEQPAVRYFQGKQEIGEIFDIIANSKSKVQFIHSLSGIDFYGLKAMHGLRMRAVKNNVQRQALTPDGVNATKNYKEADPYSLLERTWLKADDYTAPVEWGVTDDTLYIISYGKEALGLTIESPAISESFKQLFNLLERGQKLLPDYSVLPKLATKSAIIE